MQRSDTADIIYHPRSPVSDILKKAAQIAESRLPVLITGESGTGKEKIAQYIHQRSSRKDQPFIAVNCSSLNDGLIESELFGHEQGSFTGANKQKIGRFELGEMVVHCSWMRSARRPPHSKRKCCGCCRRMCSNVSVERPASGLTDASLRPRIRI